MAPAIRARPGGERRGCGLCRCAHTGLTRSMAHERSDVAAAIERYIAVRDEINAGKRPWTALAEFFTADAVFIDPAWGRVQGIEEMKRTVFGEAMDGLDDWQFPTEFYAIAGDNVVVK